MKIEIDPGVYVVAVSGGVDSMTLLHILKAMPDMRLIVTHLDHGIREDARQDRELVEETALAYGLPFEYEEARLGTTASEAEARNARYAFLERVKKKHNARAIITAHHRDDVLETALLNLLRGTGRKGLSSLRSSDEVVRPFLHVSKQEIRAYAVEHGIRWREDSTNQDERYLRNFVRRQLLPRLSTEQKRQLVIRLLDTATINLELDELLTNTLQAHIGAEGLDRRWFMQLPYDVAAEIMTTWLRGQGVRGFDRKGISRVVVAAKTALPGKRVEITAGNQLHIGKSYMNLTIR